MQDRSGPERVLSVVIKMITAGGADAVQLAEVARQAQVSMTTIYKAFPSRDELILAAVESWMDAEVYLPLADPPKDESLFDAHLRTFRRIFGPWEKNPLMAQAFMRARLGPGGDRLRNQGFAAAQPVMRGLFENVDPDLASDVRMILSNTVYALIFRFAAGELAVTDIMPTLERTLRRLLGDVAAPAPAPAPPSGQRTRRPPRPRRSAAD